MKRVIKTAIFILCIASLFIMTSCAKGPELEEVRSVVIERVTESTVLNKVFYGEGLPVYGNMYTGVDYYYVDVENSDFDTAEELKAAIARVYTKDYCMSLTETMFVGISDSIGAVLPRFTEDESGLLMQDKYAASILPGERIFDFNAMTMESSKSDVFVVRIPATLDGEKDADAVLTFRQERNENNELVWKLDSPTY